MSPESPPITVALAQVNPTVGDIDGNAAKIAEWIGSAREGGSDLVVFPELCLPGYPAEDLYLKGHFVEANVRALEELAGGVEGIVALVGFAEPVPLGPAGRGVSNSLGVLADGRV
ncbi:MAG: nitrilase-related carbon-nitrogen hydrolase, partial [Solirubrobacterales bacterium]